jgi:hypothetical protein
MFYQVIRELSPVVTCVFLQMYRNEFEVKETLWVQTKSFLYKMHVVFSNCYYRLVWSYTTDIISTCLILISRIFPRNAEVQMFMPCLGVLEERRWNPGFLFSRGIFLRIVSLPMYLHNQLLWCFLSKLLSCPAFLKIWKSHWGGTKGLKVRDGKWTIVLASFSKI